MRGSCWGYLIGIGGLLYVGRLCSKSGEDLYRSSRLWGDLIGIQWL